MKVRGFLLILALCAGCHLTGERIDVPPVLTDSGRASVPEPASRIKQASFQDREVEDGLSLAATCLKRGDALAAAGHLREHLKRFPEQVMIRAYLAELLFKSAKYADAQDQFERFIAEASESDGPARENVVHVHTRLMEIAQQRDEAYGEHLHRGIGMVLLVRKLDESGVADETEPGLRERMLCKAAAELGRAAKQRASEARPYWYLAEVWKKLDQPRPREKALAMARERAALMPLASAEQRALLLAR